MKGEKIMETEKQLGIVTMCADKRFHRLAEEKFRELSGLTSEQYWICATAGGSQAIGEQSAFSTPDYAYTHGARHMGWAGHGDSCGGYPNVSTKEMEEKLDAVITLMQQRYPKAAHYRIFSTNETTIGTKI